jgi:[protein-PII] uridylyltransferase
LRDARARLVADSALGGPAFGAAYAALLDGVLAPLFERAAGEEAAALVSLGSYAREELCPGSDVDLLLLHGGGRTIPALADALWYPLWDAGFVVGHSARTLKEAVAVADGDLHVLTSMLDVRHVAGDEALSSALVERIRGLAEKRRGRLVEAFATAAAARREALIADLLEPNVKDGGGGLRDLQSLAWMGWALGPPGALGSLVEAGYVRSEDLPTLDAARDLFLTVRVALHRVTGTKSDDLRLQDQDAVAAVALRTDADDMARELAGAARAVAWIAADAWNRLRATQRGPLGRIARRDRVLARGIVARDGRVTIAADAAHDGATALRLAVAAAVHDLPVDRQALATLAPPDAADGWAPDWSSGAGADLVTLLRQGRRAIPVIESLEHAGVWLSLLPEWEHVRSRPQRNAYHRFTVDRHLLEAVAESVELLDGADTTEVFDRDVARHLDRPELLVVCALLHDIGKGLPGDHSEAGAEMAVGLCRRLGFDDEALGRVERVVRHHLLLADVATRRDLGEEATVARVARLVGDAPTLELLYLLTVADSQATGPAAWNSVKAALVRELFVKALHLLERGEVGAGLGEERRAELAGRVGEERATAFLDAMPVAYGAGFSADEMAAHLELLDGGSTAVAWSQDLGQQVCTVVAPDRPGMFASVAGVLSLHGLNVQQAAAHTRADGMALEVFRVVDDVGRIERRGTDPVSDDIQAALADDLDVGAGMAERARHYAPARRRTAPPTPPRVYVDQEASDFATVVEVHADDRVGLLFQITRVLADLGLDVHLAKVSTIGDRVVDAFYVRDASGGKLGEPDVERVRHTLLGRLQRA